ncbi:hypothetical protein EJ02DRAFT_359214 [Clathrospora elynae]|uniref:Uncharacterized protein n=1 Tax=Clathrospora elynae TaxID=706981 RepID=A0A6A5S9D2_9PLEO|nr:hypothetical protein EJ02DRAFT_359214 [Clathrospora elynae]
MGSDGLTLPATLVISSPPSSSHTSTDADAATQQLLSESRVFNSPPPPSAILGANLLNAARIYHRQSSPVAMARTNETGKLKRASVVAGGPRQNIARRGDIYDIELSPEKERYALPEIVNRRPLKVVRKKGRAATEERSDIPSSPPGIAPAVSNEKPRQSEEPGNECTTAHDNAPEHVHTKEHLPNGKLQCTVVSYRCDSAGRRYQQCSLAGTNQTDHGPRCFRHIKKSGVARCGAVNQHGETATQCHSSAKVESIHGPRCTYHAEMQKKDNTRGVQSEKESAVADEEESGGEENALRKQKRKSKDDPDSNGRLDKSPKRTGRVEAGNKEQSKTSSSKTHPQVPIPARNTTRRKQTEETENTENSPLNQHRDVTDTIEVHVSGKSPANKQTKSQRQAANDDTAPIQQLPAKKQAAAAAEDVVPIDVPGDDGSKNDESDAEVQKSAADEDEDEDEDSEYNFETTQGIDAVFKFLHLEKRPGKCETKLGNTIKRICVRSCNQVQDEDSSLDHVIAGMEDVLGVLSGVNKSVKKEDQRTFKGDVYAYIFRVLTRYLEAVYRWFHEQCDVVTKSLEAMHVLSSLVHAILVFKDTVAKWDVSIPQRYKGDRVIKDVESRLIAPLRQVDKTFRIRLGRLEAAKQLREQHAEMMRKLQEEADEKRRRSEAVEARKERWIRWQNLHVLRMQCEPDPTRRRRLLITKLEDMEETDANGVKFERVPIFKKRSAPPSRPASTLPEERVWTEKEEESLVKGLEDFAGPQVFEDIIKEHCRPGGALRDCSVADIAARAAWVRPAYAKLQEEKGWPIPDWVTGIPVLP